MTSRHATSPAGFDGGRSPDLLPADPAAPGTGPGVAAMLEARSVALVGASPRPDSLAYRALVELERSTRVPAVHLVNPRRAGESVRGRRVLGSLEEIDGPVDLVLLAVADGRLEAALASAARRGDRSAVIFGSATDTVPTAATPAGASGGEVESLRVRLARIARGADMAICGGGCMGFVSKTLRAIGYLEPAPLPPGPIALVTHSGSAFS
ncbi:MAG TPA: CoA-binding protein, partial [Acidimicrobiales bacterium]|nr:CoA-binding protein [Acidimicrobiales bacterium]